MIKKITVPALILTAICIVAALALGFTDMLTRDKIAENQLKTQTEAVALVLPADDYEEITIGGQTAYKGIKDGALAGYAFITSARGYGGDIQIVTAINENKILGVTVISCNDETPGLGQNVKSDKFLSQFSGLTETAEIGSNVDAWTGATISSKAVTSAVQEAQQLYKEAVK
jgi:electron transport complex protein RnfG